ncbi:SusC/RagA family TonB-linked outer membrane protein [Rufibacter immobilis]|uniref:SusC/RagA family TonB-linked outer membrane protein n=1 Tax=Rufibacter immobilis TaxID=1348778 RepID=A0A3M9N742_9BACT|nr:SusC/RagA family TonB-linked outer membrane protein [Rufibacter immobilis]RNI33205.1 SusC/RagA family TonB-linked outer membrane protein [Rufibacter immobilis]
MYKTLHKLPPLALVFWLSGYIVPANGQLLASADQQLRQNLAAKETTTSPLPQTAPRTTLLSTNQSIPTRTITGKITSSSGEPLPGVTVLLKGTTVATATGADGSYTLTLPANTGTLVFSYVGFKTREVNIPEANTLNIVLEEDSQTLNEVVVTALGIKREEKALGYSATTVQGDQLTESLSNNWTDALSGKVAGVNLSRSGGGPAGSNAIILRGESNLTGENGALIVVDGVVINNGSGRMTGSAGGDQPVDFGNGLNDINPEDIETVTVLKGPGAAALYGQRGANGAVVITTKSGTSRVKGIGVTVNSNTSIESISRWPDWQYEYGQGLDGQQYYSWGATADGPTTRSTSSAWGPKFEGQKYFQFDPVTQTTGKERTPWVAYPNAIKDFFQTGKTFTNTVTLDGGNANTAVRFSFTNLHNEWVMPNTGYNRNTVALSASHRVNEKLQIATKINYTNKSTDNLPAIGYNNQTVMYWTSYWVPNGDLNWLRNYWRNNRVGIEQNYPFSSLPDNPFLISYEMLNGQNRNGVTGNINATYNFTKDLSLMVRTAIDFAHDKRTQQRPFDTERFKQGRFVSQNIYSQEANSDFLLKYNKIINNKFDFSVSAGGSHLSNEYMSDEIRAENLIYPQIYKIANSRDLPIVVPFRSSFVINSFYGLATFGFNDYLFLDVTARNDWNSVLATTTSTKNVSFFYPSVNLSAIVSEMLRFPSAISYMKVRGSYAGVGSGRNTPYQTFVGYNAVTGFPGALANQTTLANEDLKPLYTTSYEAGLEMRFLKNRLGLNLTVYSGSTKDQILTAGLDRSTGLNAAVINAGEVRNQGIEIEANATLLKSKKGLNWKAFSTFSANRNKVLSLTEDLPSLQLQTGLRGAVEARVGGRMDAIYGIGYQRAPDGQIIYENGYPLQTQEPIYLGHTNPNWKASLGNEFRYKQFRFSFLVDGQAGGSAYSMTNAINTELGKIKSTLPGRDNGIVGKGVIANRDAEGNLDGTYRPNDVITENITTYYVAHAGRENVEGNTFSTDFLKLREARFDYTLPASLYKRIGLQKASIGIYGRDLFIWSPWPIYDPEFGTLTGGSIDKGFETAQLPSTRTIGLNITVGF